MSPEWLRHTSDRGRERPKAEMRTTGVEEGLEIEGTYVFNASNFMVEMADMARLMTR
jgi:hypothetical protein